MLVLLDKNPHGLENPHPISAYLTFDEFIEGKKLKNIEMLQYTIAICHCHPIHQKMKLLGYTLDHLKQNV